MPTRAARCHADQQIGWGSADGRRSVSRLPAMLPSGTSWRVRGRRWEPPWEIVETLRLQPSGARADLPRQWKDENAFARLRLSALLASVILAGDADGLRSGRFGPDRPTQSERGASRRAAPGVRPGTTAVTVAARRAQRLVPARGLQRDPRDHADVDPAAIGYGLSVIVRVQPAVSSSTSSASSSSPPRDRGVPPDHAATTATSPRPRPAPRRTPARPCRRSRPG